jgi:hypothetical protein
MSQGESMPILFTYKCAQCGLESEPSTNQIIPIGWIVVGGSGGIAGQPGAGPDYFDKWQCVSEYSQARMAENV